jgi:hypothetical protein
MLELEQDGAGGRGVERAVGECNGVAAGRGMSVGGRGPGAGRGCEAAAVLG